MCPKLQCLYLDWQQYLSDPPFSWYPSDWFSQMVRNPDWGQLAGKLRCLEAVFPASYDPNAYSLNPGDLSPFLGVTGTNLKVLKLQGAGFGHSLNLLEILFTCKWLEELVLDLCSVYVSPMQTARGTNCNLTHFRLTDSAASILHNKANMCSTLARVCPNLVEVVIQPNKATCCAGFSPNEILQLKTLHHLNRLSVVLSTKDCVSNMPAVVYVLREFSSLRHLVLSWGIAPHTWKVSCG